jgi:acyl-CoA dehydrogenase
VTAVTGVDSDLVDMMDAVFSAYRVTHPPTANAELDVELWQHLDDLGLVRLTGSEDDGGSGADWYEAAELLTAAVRHGVRVPLAEHDVLAGWLREHLRIPADKSRRTVCLLNDHGVALSVPWAAATDRIVTVWRVDGEYRAADIATASLEINPGFNIVGEPRDTVAADIATLRGAPVDASVVARLRLKSALVRSIQVCAALDRILELSVEHTTSRIQFGRPISKFQALQNSIADIAAEAALARAATDAALNAAVASDWLAPSLDFLVAASRSCVGHAASVVVRNAHQVHGAIGTTREHRLHEFTRPAVAWRSEFGSVRYWDDEVTRSAVKAGATGLWRLITD